MTSNERKEFLRKPFLLPPDVLIFPVKELSERVRAQLECVDDDFAVTRPGIRSFSRIVDRDTAILLDEFRNPSPIAEAILRYCSRYDLDPHDILEKAFPVLVSFSAAHFLVPADSVLAEGITFSFGAGQLVSDYEVCRPIQVLEDTELYLAYTHDRTPVALKISRPEPSNTTILTLRREATVLTHLKGICCPRLLEHSSFDNRPYLVSSWVSGVPISKRANEIRTAAIPTWRNYMHQLCCDLINSYSALHENSIIHGDIHPRNVLVNADDSVILLDFGLARIVGKDEFEHSFRSGLAWFIEPELAATFLKGQEPHYATFAGEQYSVAALIYFLICGEHYLTAGTEREALYRQIIDVPPPPFTRHGFQSWPEIEIVLQRALAKQPKQRFSSMREFGDAFQKAWQPKMERQIFLFPQVIKQQGWVEEILHRTAYDIRTCDDLFPESHSASIYFGVAGLVWFLYRAAQVRDDPHLIAAADLWSQEIMNDLDSPGRFDAPNSTSSQDWIQSPSLFLQKYGAHLVYALVSHTRGELTQTVKQIQAFINSKNFMHEGIELLYGRSGLLVGGTMILDFLLWLPRFDAGIVSEVLLLEAHRIWKDLQNLPVIGEKSNQPHLGIAHGWAGILYAQMLIHNQLQLPLSGTIHDRLLQLANQTEPVGRGVSWPGTLLHPGQSSETLAHAPGWCSGSAGYVYLWTLAYEIYQETKFQELAEKAAWHTWEHLDRFPNLCCGLAGRAFALLRYYRYSGDHHWLLRAKQIAGLAFRSYDDGLDWDTRTLSLFRGALGPALLAVELERPELAVMPVFEPEGWFSSGMREITDKKV